MLTEKFYICNLHLTLKLLEIAYITCKGITKLIYIYIVYRLWLCLHVYSLPMCFLSHYFLCFEPFGHFCSNQTQEKMIVSNYISVVIINVGSQVEERIIVHCCSRGYSESLHIHKGICKAERFCEFSATWIAPRVY